MKLMLLLLCLWSTLILAQQQDTSIYIVAEEMPRFPGCEDSNSFIKAKKACADRKLLDYIYRNLKMPKDIDIASLGSMAAISFVIDETGKVINPTIIRSMHPEIDTSIIDLVRNMPTWISGKQRGKAVKVRYVLPVRICFR